MFLERQIQCHSIVVKTRNTKAPPTKHHFLSHPQEESHHTKLASYYLDDVLKLSSEPPPATQQQLDVSKEQLDASREKLLNFLETSPYYRAPELLSKVQDSDLHRECALLYGRVSGCGARSKNRVMCDVIVL